MKTNIDLLYFFITLFIGLYIVYITSPKPNIILEYPTEKEHFTNTENGINYNYVYGDINCSF